MEKFPHSFEFSPINDIDVENAIQEIKSKNSIGIDSISTKMLKFLKPLIVKPLTLIINQSLRTGIFPENLKIAKIIPVYKKEDKTSFNNYRPISILPAISKVFETIMYKQLYSYLEKYKLLFDKQYGFRKGRSTELATVELVDGLLNDMENGDLPICFFIDLSKAFDTLNHTILIEKLQYYGIRNNTLELFRNYLSNRKQYVEYDGTKSDYLTLQTGVPQGSVLGPLLFLIYMNDIAVASKLFKFILFADDTTLKSTMNIMKDDKRSCRDISITINNELEKINLWLKANKLSLNIGKTKYMLFHKHNKIIPELKLKINNVILEKVNEFCFLGLNLDTNLTWNAHIRKISGKLNRSIGVLNKLKYTLPQKIKILIYNSFILSQINYCILAWGFKVDELSLHQKAAVRIISNSNFTAHSEPILKNLNLLKFPDIFNLHKIKFYYKYLKNDLPIYFLDFEFKENKNIHLHDTRNKSDHHTNKVKRVYADNCIRNNMSHFLNNLDISIKEKFHTHSLKSIKHYFRERTILGYNFVCTEKYCYSCYRIDIRNFQYPALLTIMHYIKLDLTY